MLVALGSIRSSGSAEMTLCEVTNEIYAIFDQCFSSPFKLLMARVGTPLKYFLVCICSGRWFKASRRNKLRTFSVLIYDLSNFTLAF